MHNHKNRMFALRAKCSNSQPCRMICRSSICWNMATNESRNGNDSKSKETRFQRQVRNMFVIKGRRGTMSSSLARALLAPVTTGKSLWGNTLLLDEQVNQGLHRLHFLVRNKLVVFCNSNKMNKAHVEDVVLVNVPERVQPVCMV